MTRGEFAEAVHTYCALTDASVSSWGRVAWYNGWKGGVEYSSHLFWLGADVRGWIHLSPLEQEEVVKLGLRPAGGFLTIEREMRVEIGRRLGLRVLYEGDHDHLQPLDWRAG